MTFTVVTGEADACGPGCSRWIAAEGVIVADTPLVFFEVMKRLDGTRPPLLIQSQGGVVDAAMALGRQVRRAASPPWSRAPTGPAPLPCRRRTASATAPASTC